MPYTNIGNASKKRYRAKAVQRQRSTCPTMGQSMGEYGDTPGGQHGFSRNTTWNHGTVIIGRDGYE